MPESAHTTETPVSGDVDNGAAITTGGTYKFATAGFVTHIRFWCPTTNSGTYTVALHSVDIDDDPAGSGTGTELATASVASASVTPDQFNNVAITPVAVTDTDYYRAAVHSSSGRIVATGAAFTGAAITNGDVTAIEDGTASPLGSLRNGTFTEGASLAYPASTFNGTDYFVDVVFELSLPTVRRRRVTTYAPGTDGKLNQIMTILGTTTPSLWPFWEPAGTLVTGISVGDLIPSETAGAAEALEDDFAPLLLPSGLYSYHLHPTGDHHLAGADSANYTFGNGTVDTPFSCGAWIRPNAIASNTIMAKYSATVREWRFWIDAAGLLDLELYDESADTTEIAVSDAAMTIGQWVFAVATYDGTETAPVVNLYVDGTLVNDGTTTEDGAYVAMEDTATPLTVGCSGVTATPVNEFHGRMALPFITGKALTAAEVGSLHRLTAPMVGI